MLSYYFYLALRSLRRDVTFTVLMVVSIGLGIGATMTMMTVLHVMSGDPIPERSSMLFVPHINPLPLSYKQNSDAPDPSENFTWPDAMAIVNAHVGDHQAAMAGGTVLVRTFGATGRPLYVDGRFTTSEFFSLFGLTFQHGRGWSRNDDDQHARLVVLSSALAMTLTGTTECIGRLVRLGEHDFQIIGVIHDWHPSPMFYADATAKSFGAADQFFIPLSAAIDADLSVNGNVSSWGQNSTAKAMLTGSTATWLQVWVQLSDAGHQHAFAEFLSNYVAQQRALGRYEQPASGVHVYGLMDYMKHLHLVPKDVLLQFWASLGFLFVCTVNMVGLLLAKFLRRQGEISVRRAMGASRSQIFFQFSVESVLIGLVGGMIGIIISQAGLYIVRSRPDDYARLAHMDFLMLISTFVLAVMASVLSGLVPAWRACQTQPSLQMKSI